MRTVTIQVPDAVYGDGDMKAVENWTVIRGAIQGENGVAVLLIGNDLHQSADSSVELSGERIITLLGMLDFLGESIKQHIGLTAEQQKQKIEPDPPQRGPRRFDADKFMKLVTAIDRKKLKTVEGMAETINTIIGAITEPQPGKVDAMECLLYLGFINGAVDHYLAAHPDHAPDCPTNHMVRGVNRAIHEHFLGELPPIPDFSAMMN